MTIVQRRPYPVCTHRNQDSRPWTSDSLLQGATKETAIEKSLSRRERKEGRCGEVVAIGTIRFMGNGNGAEAEKSVTGTECR